MPHFSPIYCFTVIFIAVLVTDSEAKRGCALYGHSCYGGHGKRSDVPRVDVSLESPLDKGYSNINKEIFYPMNNELHGISSYEHELRDNFKFCDIEFGKSNIFQIDEAKKNSEEAQQTPETDTIFKNTYV